MQVGRHRSSAPRIWGSDGLQFYHPRGEGIGKVCFFLSGSCSSSLVCMYSSQQKGSPQVLKLLPCSESECRPHPIPTQPSEAFLTPPLIKQACLWADGFLEQLLTYSDLQLSLKFPPLSMVLYWDFYRRAWRDSSFRELSETVEVKDFPCGSAVTKPD